MRQLQAVGFILGLLGSGSLVAQQNSRWLEWGSRVEVSDINPALYPTLADWLEKNGQSPLDYIVQKCQTHQLVIFGELHGIKDYTDLFLQAIPEAYHRAGVRYVVLEGARYDENERIARLVEDETFDRELFLGRRRTQRVFREQMMEREGATKGTGASRSHFQPNETFDENEEGIAIIFIPERS